MVLINLIIILLWVLFLKEYCCIFCKKKGPQYHNKNCIDPFDTSLYPTKNNPNCTIEGKSFSNKKKGKFKNCVQIKYRYDNEDIVIIKIFENGKIVKTIDTLKDNIVNKLIDIINDLDVADDDYSNFITRITDVKDNFRLYKEKDDYKINLYKLDEKLKKFNFKNYYFKEGNQVNIDGNPTRNFINFYLNNNDFKINVQLEQRGGVSLVVSPCTENDVKENKCSEVKKNNYSKKDIEKEIKLVQDYLKKIIPINDILIAIPKKIKKMQNTKIGGKYNQHLKSNCKNDVRPIPYSFKGKCKKPGYYVPPEGKKRKNKPDQLWEPCCAKLSDNKIPKYKKTLKEGFPLSEKERIKFEVGKTDKEDRQKTLTGESRIFTGLSKIPVSLMIDTIRQYYENKNILIDNKIWMDFLKSYKIDYIFQQPLDIVEEDFQKLFTSDNNEFFFNF